MKHLNILENNIGCLFHMHEKKYSIFPAEIWEISHKENYASEKMWKLWPNTKGIKTPCLFLDCKEDITWMDSANDPLYKIKYLYDGKIGVSWLSLRETQNCEVVLPAQTT